MDCSTCDGKCCKYVAMEIDCPEDLDDFENIKWYVAHKDVSVYVDEDGNWNIEFITPCEHLGEGNLCKIYDRRPSICRDYKQDECTYHNDYAEKYTFKTVEDVEKYVEDVFLMGAHFIPEEEEDDEDEEYEEDDSEEEYEEDDSEENELEEDSTPETLIVEEVEVSLTNNDEKKEEENIF